METAIGELTETYGLVSDAAQAEFQESLPDIISEAQTMLDEKFSDMESDAIAAGANVAAAWNTNFAIEASKWRGTVATYAQQAKDALHDVWGIQSPSSVAIDAADNIAGSFSKQLSKHSLTGSFGFPTTVATPVLGRGGGGNIVDRAPAEPVQHNVNIEINNPSVESADRDAIKATVLDRLAGVL